MVNAPSRIASLLIAASGVWATTRNEFAVVDPGETTPDLLPASWAIIVEYSLGASNSNSCPPPFKILNNHVNGVLLLGCLLLCSY